MTAPHIHPRYRTTPASLLLETLGGSLAAIKREDRVTDADLGEVLLKSADRASAYRIGDGDMGVVSFLRGCERWDGRFANPVLALVGMKLVPLDGDELGDQACVTTILRLALDLSAELERDGDIGDADLERLRPTIERVGRVIDGYRARLRAIDAPGLRPLLPRARDGPPEPPG